MLSAFFRIASSRLGFCIREITGRMRAVMLGISPFLFSSTAFTAPQFSCPITRMMLAPRMETANRMLSSWRGPITLPATRTTKRSPTSWSNKVSGDTRESLQQTMTANGFCRETRDSRRTWSRFGWASLSCTYRSFPARSFAKAFLQSKRFVPRNPGGHCTIFYVFRLCRFFAFSLAIVSLILLIAILRRLLSARLNVPVLVLRRILVLIPILLLSGLVVLPSCIYFFRVKPLIDLAGKVRRQILRRRKLFASSIVELFRKLGFSRSPFSGTSALCRIKKLVSNLLSDVLIVVGHNYAPFL